MVMDDTIAAISTPAGQGGIGIVRISGKDAIRIADTVFRAPTLKKLSQSPSHRILYGHVIDGHQEDIIDEVLVSVMRGPRTYTKEDVVEINCHGGAVPVRSVLEAVLKNGARLAEPGEFTRRAFLNGRIDLAQAEAVLDVINSLTVQSQKSSLAQLRGSLSEKIESIRNETAELTALVEAHIDFPEEDIQSIDRDDMTQRAARIRQSLEKLIRGARYGMILREGLKTAIIGRPNVGKSSLLNALLDHDRAIVTEMPGTTRDVIEEYLNIEGLPLKIMDTAGIRSVEDIAEKEGVRRSLQSMEDADLVLLLLDGSEELHRTDKELMSKSENKKRIVVINKSDLPQKIIPPRPPLKKGGWGDYRNNLITISAKQGTGLEVLRKDIVKAALQGQKEPSSVEVVTNVRHVRALEKALASLDSFTDEADRKTSPEFLSVELGEALNAIGEIVGITTSDDILNRIFSNFCIGK
jgi:tRNA modification GTPase